MRFKGVKAKMKLFFFQYIPEAYKVNKKSEQCITTTRCSITERLQVHDPAERRIKKINDRQNKIPGAMNMTSH